MSIADFLNAILDLPDAEHYRDTVILRPGGITLVLSVYEQVLVKLGARPQPDQLSEYAVAFVLALDQIVGGHAAATSFVKNQLTSYAQRREVMTKIVNTMRSILDDQDFGQGISSETPLDRRVTATERRLAQLVADVLQIRTMRDFRQKSPEGVWRSIEGRIPQRQSGEPLHALLTLGEIKQIMERRDNRSDVLDRLMDSDEGFSSENEVFVALDGLIGLRNPLQHGRAVQNQRLGMAYLSTFERVLEL